MASPPHEMTVTVLVPGHIGKHATGPATSAIIAPDVFRPSTLGAHSRLAPAYCSRGRLWTANRRGWNSPPCAARRSAWRNPEGGAPRIAGLADRNRRRDGVAAGRAAVPERDGGPPDRGNDSAEAAGHDARPDDTTGTIALRAATDWRRHTVDGRWRRAARNLFRPVSAPAFHRGPDADRNLCLPGLPRSSAGPDCARVLSAYHLCTGRFSQVE